MCDKKYTLLILFYCLLTPCLYAQELIEIGTDQIKMSISSRYQYHILNYGQRFPNDIDEKPYVVIWTFRKDKDFFETGGYSSKNFTEIENSIRNNNPNNIDLDWGIGQLISVKGKRLYDCLVFSRDEVEDQTIERIVFGYTNSYWIIVRFFGNNLKEQIIKEVPQYFTTRNRVRIWNFEKKDEAGRDSLELFYRRTMSGTIESLHLRDWYNETTKIIESIVLFE
jgi:hypothetical protein